MLRPTIRKSLLILLVFILTVPVFAQGGVPDARYERLLRGVNITRWFWNPEGIDRSADHAVTYISDAQLAEIRAAGFLHVRLPIEPTRLVDLNAPGVIDPLLLADLDQAIARMIAQDLAVIVDPHNWDEDWFNRLLNDSAQQQAFVKMWRALAKHLAATDPELVFLEVMNEPMTDADSWLPLQAEVVAAMRAVAPDHTIIVGGPQWNSIDGLMQVQPFDDPNIIYNFHFYEPWVFTHQGAIWAGDIGRLRGLPYPSSWWNGCGYLPSVGGQIDDWVQDYCYGDVWEDWRVDDRIRLVSEWAQQHGVRLTVNEFGVMPTAPFDSRLRWFRAAVSTFERYGIGWTLWGYDDMFGLDYYGLGFMDSGVLQVLEL
jgi:hypothetical protein